MSQVPHQSLNPPTRILLGAGPSSVGPRVLRAMTAPIVGQHDPYFENLVRDIQGLLRFTFRTKNPLTFPVAGTGSGGMQAAFDNFLGPGDVAVIGINGAFGERMLDIAGRTGAKIVPVKAEWGKIIEPEQIEEALKSQKKVKLLAIVHIETSTGILQPLAEVSKLAKDYGALFLVDAVTSHGGQELAVDDWGIDICYSATQKCIGAPTGLSPFTANKEAFNTLAKRKQKVKNWYMDLQLNTNALDGGLIYHHTAPSSMLYAIHEALTMIIEEGLEARVGRHMKNGKALQDGLEAMGLKLFADRKHRARVLTTVKIPEGIDDLRVRQRLLNGAGIEIGRGIGPLRGKIWRIGLLGNSSTEENVLICLKELERQLAKEGFKSEPGVGVSAAIKALNK